MRLNSVTVEKNKQTTNIQLRDTKLISVKNFTTPYNCVRSEDITDYLVYAKVAQIVKDDTTALTINLLEAVEMFWSANFHLKMFYLLRDVGGFLGDLKKLLPRKSVSDEGKTVGAFNFLVYGVFTFHVRISKEHSARISLGKKSLLHVWVFLLPKDGF